MMIATGRRKIRKYCLKMTVFTSLILTYKLDYVKVDLIYIQD